MSKQPTLEQRLAELTRTYVESLPGRLDELRGFLNQYSELEHGEANASVLGELRGCAHKLVGSGATFGFHNLSAVAFELEEFCNNEEEVTFPQLEKLVSDVADDITGILNTTTDGGDNQHPALEIQSIEIQAKPQIAFLGTESDIADAISAQLDKFNYAMTKFGCQDDLAAAMARESFAAVIVDDGFVGDDKIEGAALSRLLDEQDDRPVLITLSSRGDLDARVAAVRAGSNHYLLKPIEPIAIVDVLDSASTGENEDQGRVLVVDDDESMGQYVSAILSNAGMNVEWVQNASDLAARVEGFGPELILMDLYLPGCSGQELAAVLRQMERFASIPIVFLSGEKDRDKQITAMEQGGDGFLTKPVNPGHLVRSVQSRINRFRRIRARMVRDGLTNLYNHTTMNQFLANEMERAKRQESKLCYAIIDIDHFKSVNDTHGHGVGDVVLKTLSRLLRQRLRASDIIGRLGGEEFGVILADTEMSYAAIVLDQVRIAFQELVHAGDGVTFHVTFSCGVAEFPAYSHPTEIAEAADKALYEAKHAGRNRIVQSHPVAEDQ